MKGVFGRVRTKVYWGYLLDKYPTQVFRRARCGLNTLPHTPVRFGTNSIPVPDPSVCSVYAQQKYPGNIPVCTLSNTHGISISCFVLRATASIGQPTLYARVRTTCLLEQAVRKSCTAVVKPALDTTPPRKCSQVSQVHMFSVPRYCCHSSFNQPSQPKSCSTDLEIRLVFFLGIHVCFALRQCVFMYMFQSDTHFTMFTSLRPPFTRPHLLSHAVHIVGWQA